MRTHLLSALLVPSALALLLEGAAAQPEAWADREAEPGVPAGPSDVAAAGGSAAAADGGVAALGLPAAARVAQEAALPRHEFTFARAVYSDGRMGRGWGRGSWSTDYPKADEQFLVVLRRLVDLDAYQGAAPVRLDDPELRRFPFLYAVEVGRMAMTQPEVDGLRSYLEAGGFLMVDDFWGTWEWQRFEEEIRRVLPGRAIVDVPMDHELLRVFYDIQEIQQVPNVWNGRSGGPTHERDGYTPALRAIFDDDGRLMVLINWNTDLGDAWEWAEDPYYPLKYSTFAYQLAANAIVYAMSH